MINTTIKQLFAEALTKKCSINIDSNSHDDTFAIWIFDHKYGPVSGFEYRRNVTPDMLEETLLWMLVRM